MNAKRLKHAAAATGLFGLLYAGYRISTTNEDKTPHVRGYTSEIEFSPGTILRDIQTIDPTEFNEAINVQRRILYGVLNDYATAVKAGAYDASLSSVEQQLYSMLDTISQARSPEGNATSFAKQCSVDKLADYLTFEQGKKSSERDQQAMSYLVVAEHSLSENVKKGFYVSCAGVAVQGGYLNEEQQTALLQTLSLHTSPETLFDVATEAIMRASTDAQRTFGLDVLGKLPDEQQYAVMGTFLSTADNTLVDPLLASAVPYSSAKGKEQLAMAAVSDIDTKQKGSVLVSMTKDLSKDMYDGIRNFFGSK